MYVSSKKTLLKLIQSACKVNDLLEEFAASRDHVWQVWMLINIKLCTRVLRDNFFLEVVNWDEYHAEINKMCSFQSVKFVFHTGMVCLHGFIKKIAT